MAMRLDQYLVTAYQFTRNKAQQLILTNLVSLDGKICNKSSQSVREGVLVTISDDRRVHWVSRSAEKLAGFIEVHSIIVSGAICLDVGASTGWFTQVLLSYGAEHIDAVDIGTHQLHPSIRSNLRVSSYEQTDIRDFAANHQQSKIYQVIVCDASFISLHEIIDSILTLADSNTMIILLYKPQFEVWREQLRKTGIPKDQKIVEEKMKEFEKMLSSKNILIRNREKSTLMGEAGNQEWIYQIQKN